MYFVLQKDSILIRTSKGIYICPKINHVLNVIAKGDSTPSIIHNYQGKAMLDFKHSKTLNTSLRIEVNPAIVSGYTKSDWIYSDTNPGNWVADPNYDQYGNSKSVTYSVRKEVKNEPSRRLDQI